MRILLRIRAAQPDLLEQFAHTRINGLRRSRRR